MIRVLLFAGLAEAAGCSVVTLPLEKETVTIQEVRLLLADRYPGLKDLLEKSMAAINQEYARNEDEVSESDEIAFIPPVSGG